MQNILLVNNDLDLLSLLKAWLERKRYRVQVTTSHRDVQAIISSFKPGLVLADILQEKAVRNIKETAITKNLPVLLMTGHTNRLKNETYHADDFIEKPFNLPLLETKIEQLLCRNGES